MQGDVEAEGEGHTRPAMNVPRNVLDAFDGLVVKEQQRRTAAALLILQHAQHALSSAQGKELTAGIKYIVKRLVTGLASSRLCAREGYFSTLCILLQMHPTSFSSSFILSLLTDKMFTKTKALSKDDAKEQMIAELLLHGAMVRSGQAGRNPQVLAMVVRKLCAMRAMKSYLDITATQFLVNLMEECTGDSVYEEVWNNLKPEVQGSIEELSPSQLWMRLVLMRKHRVSSLAWLTATVSHKNYPALARALMGTTCFLPKVHPVLEELMSRLAASNNHKNASSPSPLVKFWGLSYAALEGHTTQGKLHVSLAILRLMIPHLRTVSDFTKVVTPSVITLMLTSLTQPVRHLKEAARGVTSALVQMVRETQDEESELQLAVVSALVNPPGNVRFDQLAGHKVLSLMTQHFTLRTIKGFAKILVEIMNTQAENVKVIDKNSAAHTLGTLVAHPRVCIPEAATWRQEQLESLMKVAFFTPEEESEGFTTTDAFLKALSKHVGHIREYKSVLLKLVEMANQELQARESSGSPIPMDDCGMEQWSQVCSRLDELKGEKHEEGIEGDVIKTVFQVLYCQMALYLFVDAKSAISIIKEVNSGYREVLSLGMVKREVEEEEEEVGMEKPQWVEVVTELLLSLMTHEVHVFRLVVQGLFWLMTPHMTALALSLLTDVLDTDKAKDLVRKENDRDRMEEEDMEDEVAEETGSDNTEDSDSEDEEEEEDEVQDSNLFSLKKKMLAVTGDFEVDIDLDSAPQEELDQLDQQLSELLSEYRGKHLGHKKRRKGGGGGGGGGPQLPSDEISLMHFQTRVCDMLIVYIKAAPSMSLQVGLVNPVFKALRMADLDVRQKDFQNKLANVINVLGKKKKFDSAGDITVDSWALIVSDFFYFACQMPERFLNVVQSCYSQLMHCGFLLMGENTSQPDNVLINTYITHLQDFFTRNYQMPKVKPFLDPCSYHLGGLWRVMEVLGRLAFDSTVKVHKQAQALKTMQGLYNNKAVLGDREHNHAQNVEGEFYASVIKALNSMESQCFINGLFVSNLLQLLHTILLADKRKETHSSFRWKELRVCLEAFRERISRNAFKPFRKKYNVLIEGLRNHFSKKHQQKQNGVRKGPEVKVRMDPVVKGEINNENNSMNGLTKKMKVKKKKKDKDCLPEKTVVNEDGIQNSPKKKTEIKLEKNEDELTENTIVNKNNSLDIIEKKKIKVERDQDEPSEIMTMNEERNQGRIKKTKVKIKNLEQLASSQDNHTKKTVVKVEKNQDEFTSTQDSLTKKTKAQEKISNSHTKKRKTQNLAREGEVNGSQGWEPSNPLGPSPPKKKKTLKNMKQRMEGRAVLSVD